MQKSALTRKSPTFFCAKKAEAKEVAFHPHDILDRCIPAGSHTSWYISEALRRYSELEINSKPPCLRSVVVVLRTVGQPTPAFWGPQPWSRECPGCLKAKGSSSCLEWQFPLPIVGQMIRAHTQMPDYLGSNPDSNPATGCVNMGQFLNLFLPQCPHLKIESNTKTYVLKFLWRLN